MAENVSSNDINLNEVIKERNVKVQKLFREGLQYTLNSAIPQDKKDGENLYIFSNMDEMHEKANEIGMKFEEIMKNVMEQNQFPRFLHQILQEQKEEAQSILKQYDDIISHLNDDLNNKSSEYRQKIEHQSLRHEKIRKKIENLFSELNRVGKEEICTLRDEIVKHSKYISDEFWKSNENFFNYTGADKPFDLYLWKKPTEMITLQQLEEAFLVDPLETFKLRRSLLSEVCKLRNELEKEKLNYNLKKQVFEQEIFYLKENYIRNRPILNKMKRKCIMLHDQRNSLLKEFTAINNEIRKEHEIKEEKHKIQSTLKLNENSSKNAYYFKYNKVFEDYNEKANSLRSSILNQEKFIFVKILEMFRSIPNSQKSEGPSEKKYWEAFLEFALKENDIDNILEIMEEYRLNLKTNNELAQHKKSLVSESQDFKCLLKFYYKFNKT
ncbi:NYD-SP28 domain-containing protein [Trichonephila clavata]|uniref:NYD-SP28 domain-containing protein n=1 Tax=Trichonephila clavata TaxID=2740835 RepID=A0A8X6FJC7_TRICU|nr:NYD-SP28 domain-containing protein [Trichonephila clavata]